MAHRIEGTYYTPCSCDVGCPCIFGAPDGDRGWCSGALLMDIRAGEAGGVDVAGARAVLAADWPRGFVSGGGTARVYFDTAVSDEQRAALEPVIQGNDGGTLAGIGAAIDNWLPSEQAAIDLQEEDGGIRYTLGDVGVAVSKPLRDPDGAITVVRNLPVAFVEDTVLARGDGTRFSPPDMREWESGGHSEQGDFVWSS